VPRRKELRKMLVKVLDMIQTIKMYASEPIKPTMVRVFDIKPEIWVWMTEHEAELIELLYGWQRMLNRKMPRALTDGATHEPVEVSAVPVPPPPADGVR